MIETCIEQSSLLLYLALQTYVFYLKKMQDDLGRQLHLEKIRIPQNLCLLATVIFKPLKPDRKGIMGIGTIFT